MLRFFTRQIGFKKLLFIAFMIFFVIYVINIKDIAILFFAAFVIACSLNPLVDKICTKYKKISRAGASAIVLFGTLLIGLAFIVPIIITAVQQIGSFIDAFPERLEHAKTFLSGIPFLTNINFDNLELGDFVKSASDVTTNIVSQSIMLSKNIAAFLIYFMATCIIIYYYMADQEAVKKAYLIFFPQDLKKRAEEIRESIAQKVGGYVIATIVTITSVGIIIFLGLALLGVDYALILGLLTAIFDLVPIVGPTIALIIILTVVCKLGALKIALTILVFFFAQWAENNLVRPYIFGKLLNIHPLIIYFFLLVTAKYLGVVGLVFAPAIAATFCVLLDELYIKNVN